MGFSISWLAIKGKTQEQLLETLGLSTTGEKAEFSDFPVTGHALPGGWQLLVMDNCDHDFIMDKYISLLSDGCYVIGCSVEEHVMYSMVTCWEKGKNLWKIEHRSELARTHLDITGKPPEEFQGILHEYTDKQTAEGKNVDWFFEIPLQLAKQITGFKHDEINPDIPDGGFEVLQWRQAAKAKLKWKFW